MTTEPVEKCERDKVALLIDACEVAARHYEDDWNAFANLDAKALGVATIGGIVLAAVVAFLKDGRAPAFAQGNCLLMLLILSSRWPR